MRLGKYIELTSVKITHQILHHGQPESLAKSMHKYRLAENTHLTGPNNLGSCPKQISKSIYSKNQFKSKSYTHYQKIPEVIQNITYN